MEAENALAAVTIELAVTSSRAETLSSSTRRSSLTEAVSPCAMAASTRSAAALTAASALVSAPNAFLMTLALLPSETLSGFRPVAINRHRFQPQTPCLGIGVDDVVEGRVVWQIHCL